MGTLTPDRSLDGAPVAPPEPGTPLVDWPTDASRLINREPFVTPHRIHELEIFSTPALTALLDGFPRERLEIATMGLGSNDWSDWHSVDTTDASGEDIIRAIQTGKLWAKVMRPDLYDERYLHALNRLYDEIASVCPEFRPKWLQPSILISSPKSEVYYHVDAFPTMLWQIAGVKQVWVYPINDDRLVTAKAMEEVVAGRVDEMAPYQQEFDGFAKVFELKPGELLYWPPQAPHRVVGTSKLNITMTVCYETPHTERHRQVFMANRVLRRWLGTKNPSTRIYGMRPYLKKNFYLAARRLGVLKDKVSDPDYLARYRIDPDSPQGISAIDGPPVRVPFLGNRRIRAQSARDYG